jgi:hypothetical protein
MAREPRKVARRRVPPQAASAATANEWINVVFYAAGRAASGLAGMSALPPEADMQSMSALGQ